MTKQNLEWMRLDSATSINDEGGPFHRLLIQCTTEGVAVDFKVGMKVEDVIGALRSVADRLEHRVAAEPKALPEIPPAVAKELAEELAENGRAFLEFEYGEVNFYPANRIEVLSVAEKCST